MPGDRSRPPQCLAIDTTLLLLLLGYLCLLFENRSSKERVQVLNEIRGRGDNISPERFADLWNLFLNAKRRIVTQHIVAETYGLRRRLPYRKDLVWRSGIQLLANPGIEELSCRVKDLRAEGYENVMREIGPSDAGLIFTAERLKAAIITDDRQLAHWAGVRSVPALLLKQIGAL